MELTVVRTGDRAIDLGKRLPRTLEQNTLLSGKTTLGYQLPAGTRTPPGAAQQLGADAPCHACAASAATSPEASSPGYY